MRPVRNMKKSTIHKAKLNILTTLVSQLTATACGIVIPRVMIGTFGSSVYGLITSITQFLSYISLLEGGIGRVARAELYGPLAQGNDYEVSRVYHAIKHFFKIVGVAFLLYTLALSFVYYDIAKVDVLARWDVFYLIWIISSITLAKYMGGLANLTLMNANQKQYVGNVIVMATTIVNAVLIIVLTQLGCSVFAVKIGSSLAYVAQPLCYALYVRKHYRLTNVGKDRSELKQKWTGVGQHVAFFLHTNTDVVLLTLFAEIRLVAVYSVYRLVAASIRKIASSFTGGMEAAFGELIARKEDTALRTSFRKYQFLISTVSMVLFGTAAVMIIPFVRLYTDGITDAPYIQPLFAMMLIGAEALDCVIHPCCSLPVAANQLKQSRSGSYTEAAVNIGLSLLLIRWNPLLGIAIGTLAAAIVKSVYYIIYSARKILKVQVMEVMKNFLFNCVILGLCSFAGMTLLTEQMIPNYFSWALWSAAACAIVTAATLVMSILLYPNELKALVRSVLHGKIRGRK